MDKARMVVMMVGSLVLMEVAACASSDPASAPQLDAQLDQGVDGSGSSVELCNGLDDDGDGLVDESASGTGVIVEPCATICGPGQKICLGGVMTACSAPVPDIWGVCPCSDGQLRDCFTECGYGSETCLAGVFTGCTAPEPQPEQCGDGIDDDCDGEVDEDCGTCVPGDIKRCGIDTGECSAGTRTCRVDGSWGSCVGNVGPVDEICDGLDNDCNGEPDDGLSPDMSEYNDSCNLARRLPDVFEDYGVVAETASIYPSGDEDWMWFRAVEGWHDCEPFSGQCYYALTVDLDPPSGSDLKFCLYPSWPMDSPGCDAVGDASTTFCTEPGELSMTLQWEGICMLDDTLDFVVVVREWPGSEPSCAPYTISFTMYGPDEICPGDDPGY